jgi:hypothetical protein
MRECFHWAIELSRAAPNVTHLPSSTRGAVVAARLATGDCTLWSRRAPNDARLESVPQQRPGSASDTEAPSLVAGSEAMPRARGCQLARVRTQRVLSELTDNTRLHQFAFPTHSRLMGAQRHLRWQTTLLRSL